MTRRLAVIGGLAVMMAGAGLGTYTILGHLKNAAALRAAPQDPGVTRVSAVSLTGVLYLAQGGDLFALRGGAFTRLASHTDTGGWTMPSLTSDGRLLAVLRGPNSSDLYMIDRTTGAIRGRLTSDDAGKRASDGSLELNHWAFYPRASPDGSSVIFSFDSPKCGFNNGLAIWSIPLPPAGVPITPPPPPRTVPGCSSDTGLPHGRRMTTPNPYTGGDVMPIALPGGGLLFVRYSFDTQYHVHSTLWYQGGASDPGVAVTNPDDDCAEPALAPDGMTVAMVCTHGEQSASLEVTTLSVGAGTAAGAGATPTTATAGAPSPAAASRRLGAVPEAATSAPTIIAGGLLAAFPVWAPDGGGLAYLAPAHSGGGFQLWWRAGPAGAGRAPVQLTAELGLDATSTTAWAPG